jgi:hypothetical protein
MEVVTIIIALERHMKTKHSDRIAGNLSEILTDLLPNTKQKVTLI